MTNEELKNRKVKSIKLNTNMEVMFYTINGERYIAERIYQMSADFAHYNAGKDQAYGWNSQFLVYMGKLSPYGIDELEKGNIIVEFEDESKTQKSYKEGGIEWMDNDEKNSEGTETKDLEFKTELPTENNNAFMQGLTDNYLYPVSKNQNSLIRVIRELRDIILKQDKIIKTQNQVNQAFNETIEELTERIQKLETNGQ